MRRITRVKRIDNPYEMIPLYTMEKHHGIPRYFETGKPWYSMIKYNDIPWEPWCFETGKPW